MYNNWFWSEIGYRFHGSGCTPPPNTLRNTPTPSIKVATLGSGDGTVVIALASHQCGPVFILAHSHMWVEFVISSHLALIVFLQVLQFSSLHKNIPLSNLTRVEDTHKIFKWLACYFNLFLLFFFSHFKVCKLHCIWVLHCFLSYLPVLIHFSLTTVARSSVFSTWRNKMGNVL